MSRGWYPPPSKPRPADGIKAKSRSGAIGEKWWSQRFLAVLESMGLGNRLQRGRRYARAGQVLGLDVKAGEVKARVQGSRATPYKVSVRTLPLAEKDWGRVQEALSSRAVFLAKLLAGEMPQNVEEAFAACGATLFPSSSRDLATDCSCPDWANPCKHIAATFYLLAESFDEDPFRIFAWRGRTRDELLASLRAREGAALSGAVVAGGPGAGGWSLPLVSLELNDQGASDYYECAVPLQSTGGRLPPEPAPPDAILRSLDELPVEFGGQRLASLLAAAYPLLTAYARSRLLGESEPEEAPET